MNPDELKALLTSMKEAADVVEAIDNPSLRSHRGWDLTGWNYVLVPWGVRFTHVSFLEGIDVGIGGAPDPRGNGGKPGVRPRNSFINRIQHLEHWI